jgi:carboxyl-terminal processing protease
MIVIPLTTVYAQETMRDNYGYFDIKTTNWNQVKEIYSPLAEKTVNKTEFIKLLESCIGELYDNHTHLLTNLPDSYRLVPSGLDIWAEFENDKCIIKEVRKGSGAYLAGMLPGMEIININNIPIENAITPLLGKCADKQDIETRNWALRTVLAGTHDTKRTFTVKHSGSLLSFEPDREKMISEYFDYPETIEYDTLDRNFGYIKINNSLGDNSTIAAFDSALASLWNTEGLIIDLRETPGGGNSTVARGIMSRFISKEMPYQRHEVPGEERVTGVKWSWVEYVSPRGEIYAKPVAVLVDHWTGSMGEGIAIGFSGIDRARIIGTNMARLVGAKYDFRLPNTGIGISYSAEKLFHINGTPRENYTPDIPVTPDASGNDKILEKGLDILRETLRN